ncbi:uncharacterized protein [Pyrus communis]|uniref:uncharacterized protein n=1 Tax=Pyrus communis TaxID=23211 RepID=UPI0035BFA2AA
MAGSSSSGGDLRTPQFNGSNYDFWAVKMETILIAYDLWDVVEVGLAGQQTSREEISEEEGESESEHIPVERPVVSKEEKIKNAKALSLIQGAITDELFPRIRNENTAKGAWEILRREFRGDKKVRAVKLQAIRADFEYLRMNDVESLDDYLARFFEIVNNLKSLGEDVTEKRIVQKLLMSLNLHEEREKYTGTERAFSSLKVEGNGNGTGSVKGSQYKTNPKWGQYKKGKNWSQNSWNNGSGSGWNNKFTAHNRQSSGSQGNVKPLCQVCDKYHFGICRYKGKPKCGRCRYKDCDNGKQVAHCAKEEDAVTGTMFYACHASSIASSKSVWFVDSACSNHMTSQESLLINLDKSVTCKVKMGTGDLVQATGKGTLVVET